MPLNPTFRITAIAAAVAAAFPGLALAQAVAKADFVVGDVTITGADGRSRLLAKGGDINVGELIDTRKGRVQLRYADGAQMALQPDTQFRVELFRFAEKGGGQDGIVMNLVKGGLRTITGVIGRSNRAAYSLKTPTATIGIRGTEFTAEMRDTLRAFCVQGLIFLANQGGGLLLASGQGAFVSTFTAPPQRDDTKPSLPTISRQEMEVLLALAGVDPTNPLQDFNPVVTLQTALAQLGGQKLTGSLTGSWAAAINQPGAFPGSATSVPVTFDATGNLTGFNDPSASYTATNGTATSTSAGNDGIVAWGKWSGGTTGGTNPGFSNRDVGIAPLHYVAGLPLSSMPTTGIATYSLLGSSSSCFGSGCTTAKVEGSSLVVDFSTSSIGMFMGLTIDGANGGFYQTSSTATPVSNGRFEVNGTFAGTSGSSGNLFHGSGFLSGSGALRAGMAWDGLIGATYVAGANAYTRGEIVTAPPAPPPPPPMLTGTFTGNWGAILNEPFSGQYASLNESITIDASGKLTQFVDSYEGIYTASLGTATANSLGNDGTIAWGNWMGGMAAGDHPTFSTDLQAYGPMHYVVGLPVSAMPTSGVGTYNMLGSSASCTGGGCTSAVVNGSQLSVDFGALTVGLSMSLTVNGGNPGTYTYVPMSGCAGTLFTNGQIDYLYGNFSGPGSMSFCNGFSARGFLSGAGAVRAGLVWNGQVNDGLTHVNGATAYTKQ